MITIRQSADRGHANHGWLDTYHTFSFADYQDSRHTRFRSLRVMNEDRVQPGQGFGMHPHRDMEIITYVLEGQLEHKDSMGNGSTLKPGHFQRMTAGTGVMHSEFNPSDTDPVHLYQIWILPDRKGHEPSYEEQAYTNAEKHNQLRLVASSDGRDGSLTVHQDVAVFLTCLSDKQTVVHSPTPNRHAWLQVLCGDIALNGHPLTTGDGAAVSDETELTIEAQPNAEIMLFDLA